jgi:hypothetical protein
VTQRPRINLELEAGDYIVSVREGSQRAWRILPTGTVRGHGRQLKKIAVWDALRELTIAAEVDEGIRTEGTSAARKIKD